MTNKKYCPNPKGALDLFYLYNEAMVVTVLFYADSLAHF